MSELIANEDYTLLAIAVSPGTWVPGIPSEVRTPALRSDAPGGKDILVDKIDYIYTAAPTPPATPCTLAGHTFVSGVGLVTATAVKAKCDGKAVMREGDQGTCTGSFTPPSGPAVVCTCDLVVQVAGQLKAKAA